MTTKPSIKRPAKTGPKTDGRKTYSLQSAAAILEVHRNTLKSWIEKGCPVEGTADRDAGKEWQLHLPSVIEWLKADAVSKAVERLGRDSSGGGLYDLTEDEAKRLRAIVDLQIKQIELDHERSAVVRVEQVAGVVGRALGRVRQKLMAVPHGVAIHVASVTDAGQIIKIIREAIDGALGELSNAEHWSDGGSGDGGDESDADC